MATTNIPLTAEKSFRLAYSNYLIDEVAKIINGNGYQLLAPQYVTSSEIKEHFLNEASVKEVMDLARAADVAVMGIGTVDQNSAIINAKLIPVEEFERMQEKGGTGEILSHVVNKDGELIEDDFEGRLISLSLEDLKKIPIRVGVAYGMEKKDAILSVLKGQLINVLITNDNVAEYLAKV